MKDRVRTSRIVFESSERLRIDKFSESPMPLIGWIFICTPAFLSVLGLFFTIYCRYYIDIVLFGFLCVPFISVMLSMVAIYLRGTSTFTISRSGVVEEQRFISGTQIHRIFREDILEMTASLQGSDIVKLSVLTVDNEQVTFLTIGIDSFSDCASNVTAILQMPYSFSFSCPAVQDENPDFVVLHPWLRTISLEHLGESPKVVSFDDVVSVTVSGQYEPAKFEIESTHPVYEYVYQPGIRFTDGSVCLLQRFRCFEDAPTERSRALLHAKRVSDYLQQCLTGEIYPPYFPNIEQASAEFVDIS